MARAQLLLFLQRALNGDVINIWGNGTVIRDYIHISDLAQAMFKLATIPDLPCNTFNIGSGTGVSLNDIVQELGSLLGTN